VLRDPRAGRTRGESSGSLPVATAAQRAASICTANHPVRERDGRLSPAVRGAATPRATPSAARWRRRRAYGTRCCSVARTFTAIRAPHARWGQPSRPPPVAILAQALWTLHRGASPAACRLLRAGPFITCMRPLAPDLDMCFLSNTMAVRRPSAPRRLRRALDAQRMPID
jgi:hypothetical protein